MPTPYELYYWPSIQGRGEFVRLALEDAGADYVDVARKPEAEGGGVKALLLRMKSGPGLEPFAPPFLVFGELAIAQTANILAWLAPRLRLVPDDEASRVGASQLQLTLSDLVHEAHDTHHPVASALYYEDQKPEAKRRSGAFVKDRIPKHLDYYERVLAKNDAKHLVGNAISYVDLSMFQVLEGLDYAFPSAMAKMTPSIPKLRALQSSVRERPRLKAYLASPRRIPFNEQGIFRHYPELDVSP